jgi:hypothetical protein
MKKCQILNEVSVDVSECIIQTRLERRLECSASIARIRGRNRT